MSYKCFILTKKNHFWAYNAPPGVALLDLIVLSPLLFFCGIKLVASLSQAYNKQTFWFGIFIADHLIYN
jgi:hypothetical protein